MLAGKVAVITGSSRGIGYAIAKEFAQSGATVIVCSRSKERAQKAADLLKGDVVAAQLDVADSSSVQEFISKHRHFDILVNNAGYHFDRKIWYKNFHKVMEEEFDRILQVDLKGMIRMSQAVIPMMLKKRGGVIISISSTPAISGHVEGAPYTAAKAAIVALTKHIALEYGSKNIRAYTLALGNIATEATFNSMSASERKKAAQENSMKRWGRPEEVGKVAASLADDSFSFANGNTIIVDGGTVLF